MTSDIDTALGLMAAHHLIRRRQRDPHPLVRQFFQLIEESGYAARRVSEKAGYGHATLSKWKTRGSSPWLPAFCDHLEALGYELKIVPLPATTRPNGNAKGNQ